VANKKHFSKRKQANPFEKALGIGGVTPAYAQDMFTNAAARTGFGTPSLGQGSSYELVRLSYDYWQLITLYRNHWLSRRIVDVPAQDMTKAWPKMTSEVDPKDLTRIDRVLRKTNTKNNILTGMTWGRLFGGAGGLMIIDGQENELDQPLDLESIKIGGYKGILPFDRWAGISPVGDVCTDIQRPLDFNKPEMYDVRVAGGASFQVHSSRLLRFLGPTVPTPELEAQSYWGISTLEPTYESITRLDNMYANLLNLSFRANLIGMKFPELAQLLSGLGSSQLASQKFEQRMSAVNHLMSNQSLIPLPADGSIEQTQYSFGGMADVLQLFQLDLAGAAQIPITRLFGRTYNGLGQAGDGDERIYEERISTDQSVYLVPQLEKLYPVLCMSELGEVPDDLDLVCPSIRVLDEKEKSELAKSVADTVTVYMNGGIMSQRVAAREVKQSSDTTGIGTNLTDEDIEKLPDMPQSEGEMGEGLFGEGEGGLDPAGSPTKVGKEENAAGEKAKGGEPEDKEDNDEKSAAENKKKAKDVIDFLSGLAIKQAPAIDLLPAGLTVGEKLLIGGRLREVASIGDAVEDLEGEESVPVGFTDGTVVVYAKDADGASVGNELTEAVRAKWGLPIRIETLKGMARTGVTPQGMPWATVMPAHYGFLEGHEGADGDSIDVYLGGSPESDRVWVVDQHGLNGQGFDEHKTLVGFASKDEALDCYMSGHHRSHVTFDAITEFSMSAFKRWLRTADLTKRCAELPNQ
jgi:phage-related protein (TIGR01555 family)